ncbi:MAG: hypothetical protein GXZ04_01910 [Clostridiales bacterium]|nr:hypothetical protein [Clostridiales bacterium]
MYTQNDLDAITKQLKQRVLFWLMPEVLLLLLVIVSFIQRIEWLTSLLFALLCATVLFSLVLFILPVKRYRQFLMNALFARSRTDVAAFDIIEDLATVTREGVRFYPVTMRADTIKEELDERSYYWDANLPLPDWQKGEYIELRSHERMIINWARTAKPPLEG